MFSVKKDWVPMSSLGHTPDLIPILGLFSWILEGIVAFYIKDHKIRFWDFMKNLLNWASSVVIK